MKIVIAPDSFKESLSAPEVASAVEKGFRQVLPEAEYVKVPMSDGGEGLVEALANATDGQIIEKQVTGPLGDPVQGFFGISGDGKTAVIEMAAASGLHLVSQNKQNPLMTTSRGTGELILEALDHGVEHMIIGLGGSATNDGGVGMLQALGVQLLDTDGRNIGDGGGVLSQLANIDISQLDRRLAEVKLDIACDVSNPLLGPQGASSVFGPQKGATPEMVQTLEGNLTHFSDVIERDLGKRVAHVAGAGAAGGLGAAFIAFLPSTLKKGIEIVMEACHLEEHVKEADLVITGEGKIDSQTAYGKVPAGVADIAKKYEVPVIGIAGSLSEGHEAVHEHGIDALFSSVPGVITIEEALGNAPENIQRTSKNIASVIKIFLQ
ncbi:glycerate kinase [Pseudalkalibacillus decolorationis]|uniref:glycerate kinase n=1 Tax=Pseudalkalibacillus decolorationis TaxID=163879 RepID=UPI00214850BF|nr:glycerate kinase [Pseudalkalibacillus decolorationis]